MALRIPEEELIANHLKLAESPPITAILKTPINKINYVGLQVVNQEELNAIVKVIDPAYASKDKMVCEHLTQIYRPKESQEDIIVPRGETCFVTISALVIRKSNGSSAFRVSRVVDSSGNDIIVTSGKPHITAMLANNSKPGESSQFVFEEEGVDVLPLAEPFTIKTISVWYLKR